MYVENEHPEQQDIGCAMGDYGTPNFEDHALRDTSKPYIANFDCIWTMPHWHENIELQYFYKKSRVRCGQLEFDVDDGDIAVFSTNATHSVRSLGGTHDYLIIDSSFLKKNDIDTSCIKFSPVIRDPSISELYRKVMEEVRRARDGEPYAAASTKAALLSLMVEICRKYSGEPDSENGRGETIRKAIGYIRAHFNEPLTIEEIAESVNVSKFYFCREFRRETGFTVIQYLNNFRCREAEKLLNEGKYSVGEVGRMCGFDNLSYFTRIYKQIIGVTPTKSKSNLGNQ